MSGKNVLITGVAGQDGAYLARLLIGLGYLVFGGVRTLNTDLWRLNWLGIREQVHIVPMNLGDAKQLQSAVRAIAPDIIFNLAAVSSLELSEANQGVTQNINFEAPKIIFRTAFQLNPEVKLVQASSALVFGSSAASPQNEWTPRNPDTFYGQAKLLMDLEIESLRCEGAFASSAILYNHESELRGSQFVSQKIVTGLSELAVGKGRAVRLGGLDDIRDWSFAVDIVMGMYLAVLADQPETFVLASGTGRKVREWVEISADTLGFNLVWEVHDGREVGVCRTSGSTLVEIDPGLVRAETGALRIGDSSKAQHLLNWCPKTSFEELVRTMTEAASQRVSVS